MCNKVLVYLSFGQEKSSILLFLEAAEIQIY